MELYTFYIMKNNLNSRKKSVECYCLRFLMKSFLNKLSFFIINTKKYLLNRIVQKKEKNY